jgi:hypothetical protein
VVWDITFWSEIIIGILSNVGKRYIFIINEVAVKRVKEVAPSTDDSEDDKMKLFEGMKREFINVFKRDGKGMNLFDCFCFCFRFYKDVNHDGQYWESAREDPS